MTRATTEADGQAALFDLLAHLEGRWPLLARAFHVPGEANGGGQKIRRSYTKRDGSQGYKTVPIEALRNAAMGYRKGCWDIWVPLRNRAPLWGYSARAFTGLVIEMKARGGTLSPEQEDWREFLIGEGWACHVNVGDWRPAARLILEWCGGDASQVEGL